MDSSRKDTKRYGARTFPAQIVRKNRKFPTIFENNVAITKDVDDESDKTGQGDLSVQGVVFADTIGENTLDNGVNIVSPIGMRSATLNIEEQPNVSDPKSGQILDVRGTPFTASASTPADGNVNDWSSVNIHAPALQSVNAGVTFTSPATVCIGGPPTGPGVTAGASYSIRVKEGPVLIDEGSNTALTVRGGIQCSSVASTKLQAGQVTILPPSEGTDAYDLTLPQLPPQGDGDVLTANGVGQLSFTKMDSLQPAFTSGWVGTDLRNNLTFWTDVGYTAGGKVHVSPVKPGGDPIFSTILLANASPVEETDTITSMPLASLKRISDDKKTITFNIFTGAISVVGSCTLQYAPDGMQVNVSVVGLASA
jgi:hypothetical protein